jgi:hypothetical protein
LHDAAVRSVSGLIRGGEILVVTPQIIAEFWNVATRPIGGNGLGMAHDLVRAEVAKVEQFCSIVPESIETCPSQARIVLMLTAGRCFSPPPSAADWRGDRLAGREAR